MAAISGKVVQHNLVAKCCQQDRELSTNYQLRYCTLSRRNLLLPVEGKLACNVNSSLQLGALSKFKRGIVYCNAASSSTAIPSIEKSDFLRLQNGSDIRGVAIDGVEGEHLTLTETVTEAISAGFAGWLLEKKKYVSSKCLRVSVGHDSRISAQKLQDAVSRGLARAGVEVIQYGL